MVPVIGKDMKIKMKMHPKPMINHRNAVVNVETIAHFETAMENSPFHLKFKFDDGATQRLVMTRDEAVTLFKALGVMLRFEGAKASEVDTEHWMDCHKDMRRAITPVCSHDWEDGFSMNGPTRTCKRCDKFERD